MRCRKHSLSVNCVFILASALFGITSFQAGADDSQPTFYTPRPDEKPIGWIGGLPLYAGDFEGLGPDKDDGEMPLTAKLLARQNAR